MTARGLATLSPALAGAWDRASGRERALVGAAVAVVALAAAWTWLWQPMTADVARLQRDLPRARAVLAGARAPADALAASRRSAGDVRAGDARAAVERLLAERGLREAVGTLDGKDARVRVIFTAVRFDALVGWLDALRARDGLRAVEAVVTARVEPGAVRAELTLAR